jgi:hypothetical protein
VPGQRIRGNASARPGTLFSGARVTPKSGQHNWPSLYV